MKLNEIESKKEIPIETIEIPEGITNDEIPMTPLTPAITNLQLADVLRMIYTKDRYDIVKWLNTNLYEVLDGLIYVYGGDDSGRDDYQGTTKQLFHDTVRAIGDLIHSLDEDVELFKLTHKTTHQWTNHRPKVLSHIGNRIRDKVSVPASVEDLSGTMLGVMVLIVDMIFTGHVSGIDEVLIEIRDGQFKIVSIEL